MAERRKTKEFISNLWKLMVSVHFCLMFSLFLMVQWLYNDWHNLQKKLNLRYFTRVNKSGIAEFFRNRHYNIAWSWKIFDRTWEKGLSRACCMFLNFLVLTWSFFVFVFHLSKKKSNNLTKEEGGKMRNHWII